MWTQIKATQLTERTPLRALETPSYRVRFSERDGTWEEWQLDRVTSVDDAMIWAATDGRDYALYAECPVTSVGALMRLAGAARA